MHSPKNNQGFTLIESIVGIVTLAIAFSVISTFLFPAAQQSAGEVHQVRSAELGQAFLNEILGRAFDEYSDMSGGYYRCGEDQDDSGTIESNEQCSVDRSPSVPLGPDGGESRTSYNDVDDYIASNLTGTNLLNSAGEDIGSTSYINYSVSISVCNDSNYDGVCNSTDNNFTAKLITVTVTSPLNSDVTFSVYKANF